MINPIVLEEYYKKKELIKQLKSEAEELKSYIVKELENEHVNDYENESFSLSVKYLHETTPAFINFLKHTNNHDLIKETTVARAFEKMELKYDFTPEEKQLYWHLGSNPYLYIKKK